MTPFWALVKKDIHLYLLDKRAVLMSLVAPILIGSFFGYIFAPVTRERPNKISVLVVDQDESPVSKEIVAQLTAESSLDVKPATLEAARDSVQRGNVPAAVVIPGSFGEDSVAALMGFGTRPKLSLLVDPSRQAEPAMLRGILTGRAMQAVGRGAFGGTATGFAFRPPFDADEQAVTGVRERIPYNSYAHSFAGFSVQFNLFMGVEVGAGMLLLRQRGLWRRFRAAPLSKWTILGSRALSAGMISVVLVSIVFGFARVVFDVRISTVPGFFLLAASIGLMTAAYGLLIAALARTVETARGMSILVTIFIVMLSGAWVPSFLFPTWVQNAAKVLPARWAVDGLDGVTWRGLGFSDALLASGVVSLFALLFGLVAVARFRWDE